MAINGKKKGEAGEREAAAYLTKILELDEKAERELGQARKGGADILGIGHFIFEVKRQEKLELRKWWRQVAKAARNSENAFAIPVVIYRRNRQPWRILISAAFVGLDYGFLRLDEPEAVKWLKMKYDEFKCLPI